MANYEKLLSVIKRSLGGVLPCHQVGRIAVRIADALVAEDIIKEIDGK